MRRVKDNEDGTENVHALRRNYEKERRLLQNEVKDWETHYAQLESVKQGLERDNQRLHGTVNDKEHEIQVRVYLFILITIPTTATMATMTPRTIRAIFQPSMDSGSKPRQ